MKTHQKRLCALICCITLVFSSVVIAGEIIVKPMGFSSYVPTVTDGKKTVSNSSFSPSQVIGVSNDGDISVLGLWFINSGRAVEDDIIVFRLLFNDFLYSSEGDIVIADVPFFSDEEPRLTRVPYVYPSPFRWSKDSASLGYALSVAMPIDLHIYDSFGHKILQEHYPANTNGGLEGKNFIDIDADRFGGYNLSAGVYFYAMFHEGELIAKNKFAVLP